jgi:hypothetical protein
VADFAAAANDVLSYSWYAAVDMYLYHLCPIGVPITYDQATASLEAFANATQTCGGVDAGLALPATPRATAERHCFASVASVAWVWGGATHIAGNGTAVSRSP